MIRLLQRCVAALRISTASWACAPTPTPSIAALRRSAEDFNGAGGSCGLGGSGIAALRRSAEDFNVNEVQRLSYGGAALQRCVAALRISTSQIRSQCRANSIGLQRCVAALRISTSYAGRTARGGRLLQRCVAALRISTTTRA